MGPLREQAHRDGRGDLVERGSGLRAARGGPGSRSPAIARPSRLVAARAPRDMSHGWTPRALQPVQRDARSCPTPKAAAGPAGTRAAHSKALTRRAAQTERRRRRLVHLARVRGAAQLQIQAPSINLGSMSAAACTANRVLPTPPAPVTVTNRDPPKRRRRVRAHRLGRRRLRQRHKFPGNRPRNATMESRRPIRMSQLEDALRTRQIAKTMLP